MRAVKYRIGEIITPIYQDALEEQSRTGNEIVVILEELPDDCAFNETEE